MGCFGNISFNSVIWFCAGGKAFFAGAFLLIITALIHFRTRSKPFRYGIYLLYTLAILTIILSATPLPAGFYLIWLISFIGWQIACLLRNKSAIPVLCIFIGIGLVSVLAEIPRLVHPTISPDGIEHIYVIGDSISAGMGAEDEKTWTVLLSEETGFTINNLSIAGATASSALRKQVPKVAGQNNLVFLEIGGNDLLNFNCPEEYEDCLREIILQLKDSSNRVAWFELPLLPQYYRYGVIQRKLAREFKIALIPRSVLASVFSMEGNTSDGVHLTSNGHEMMAQKIREMIK